MKAAISCHTCGAGALVEKFSWEHTTVEWQSVAHEVCPQLAAAMDDDGMLPGRVRHCSAMHDTLLDAVRDGVVPVGDDDTAPLAS